MAAAISAAVFLREDNRMKKLIVQIEINGLSNYVGDITANDFGDACFTYAESYLTNSDSRVGKRMSW